MQSIKSRRELAQSATTWYARGDLNPYPRGMEPKGDVTLVKGQGYQTWRYRMHIACFSQVYSEKFPA